MASSARPPMPSFKPPPLPQETDDLVRQCSRSPSPSPFTMPLDNSGHDVKGGARGRHFLDVPATKSTDASTKKNYESPYAPFKVYPHTFNTPPSDSPPYSRTPSPPFVVKQPVENVSRTPSPKPIDQQTSVTSTNKDDVPTRGQIVIAEGDTSSNQTKLEIGNKPKVVAKKQDKIVHKSVEDSPTAGRIEKKAPPTNVKEKIDSSTTPIELQKSVIEAPPPIVKEQPHSRIEVDNVTPTKQMNKSSLNKEDAKAAAKPSFKNDTPIKPQATPTLVDSSSEKICNNSNGQHAPAKPEEKAPPINKVQATPSVSQSPIVMSKESRQEVKKILENKSNIMEKASQRASALNLTRLCPTLVFATGSSTLRSVRLQELNVNLVILATTAEEVESGKNLPKLEGVAYKSIVLNENKDNEKQIENYLHNAADWIHNLQKGVAMIHAPDSGAFKKGTCLNDSRRGEGFAAALCAAYFIKHQGMTAQEALDNIKSRRPEAKPSTSLVLQLMDFADKIRFDKSSQGPSSRRSSTKKMSKFFQMDWKSQVKVAIPLSIYFMLMILVLKMMYEVFFESISTDESNEELVCY